MSYRTLADWVRYYRSHPYLDENTLIDEAAFGSPLFTSLEDGCLSHLFRYGNKHADRRSANGWCGTMQVNARPVDLSDETFVCRRCHQVAEKLGLPTYGLIPDGGCAVTGGRRGRKGVIRV